MDRLLRIWGLQGYDVRPLTEGTNNTGCDVGDEFVLRIHRNAIDPKYEHAVLRALNGLSFAVPVPVPVDGETAVRGELNGETVLASLSRRIPGEHPARGDAAQAEACGDLTDIHPRVPSIDSVIDGVTAEDRADARVRRSSAGTSTRSR